MAMTKYWFSAKQKRMRDALSGAVTLVKTESGWKEYTQSTSSDATPVVWNDFQLVAEGDDLECITQNSISEQDQAAAPIGAHVTTGIGQRVSA